MNEAASSSPSPSLPRVTTTESRTTPAIIPLDYNYQTMSPSSSLSRYFFHPQSHTVPGTGIAVDMDIDVEDSTQYSSLFGDPVPPPPPHDFFGSQFPDAASLLRRPSIELSSEDETIGGRSHMRRLFSEIPYSSSIKRRLSNVALVPRLQPPDIQILPHSSGGSSSEPRDSPNFALLTPEDILRRPALYDISEPADTTEVLETLTVSDAMGRHEYSEATRRVSNFSADFKSNVGSLSSPPPDIPELPSSYTRQFSNESYSSSDWFRPSSHDFPEFSKMPRMRPSSKNVMGIKRDEMSMLDSPVAAMINDSNGSSSGEERLMSTTVVLDRPTVPLTEIVPPARPPDPSGPYCSDTCMDLLLSPQQYMNQRRKSSISSMGPTLYPPTIPSSPPPIPPAPLLEEFIKDEQKEDTQSVIQDVSPVIIKDSVATGGDYRVDQARLHKKTSFTIISDKSPQSSRVQSPATHHHKSQISPFLGYGFKETVATTASTAQSNAKPRHHLQRKSLSSTQLKLPQLQKNFLTSDDSPRPSVQFNMTGRRSPSKMPHKGILQYRESVSSSQDTLPSQHPLPPKALFSTAQGYGPMIKSCETLPLITDPYRTAIPRLNQSSLDLGRESAVIPPGELPRPLKPNPNPTRRQKGLLKVINSEESMSRIPVRSNWASMDDLAIDASRRPSLSPFDLKARRRSSSTSPERRSSTQTVSDRRSSNLSSVTTSDFSFRRPSLTPQSHRRKSTFNTDSPTTNRRKSVAPSIMPPGQVLLKSGRTLRNKIAKPTTLSPILGTPNKDSSTPQSPTQTKRASSESASADLSRRGSNSKIPVRSANNSRSNSRLSSRAGSLHGSRSNSPTKDFAAMHLPLSGLSSRVTSSRSPSRGTIRSESQHTSRANSKASRSTSRASTRPISRGPSRATSRPSSRVEQAKSTANSRSNSRLSQSSPMRTGSVSPNVGRKRNSPPSRRKSISLSPKVNKRLIERRTSMSPVVNRKTLGIIKTPIIDPKQRRDSRSRIPMREKSIATPISKSPPKSKIPSTSKSTTKLKSVERKVSPSQAGSIRRKEPTSAKKIPTSVHKADSSVKRTPSSVTKQPTTVKKQPSYLQKSTSNLKREVSNVQKKPLKKAAPTSIRKERSTLNLKKATAKEGTAAVISRQSKSTTAQNEGSPQITDAAETSDVKKSAAAAVTDAAASTTKTETSTGVGKRQPSKMNLIRMGSRLSLLSRKRSDSNLSKKLDDLGAAIGEESIKATGKLTPVAKAKILSMTTAAITAQPVQISTTPSKQQNKLGTAAQLLSSAEASVLEKSQKTLENVQKTVTDATDEIQKTISENLTDLKSMESDLSRMGYESAASPTPSVATVVENKGGGAVSVVAKGADGESVSRSGTADGVTSSHKNTVGILNGEHAAQKSPIPQSQPIEATVSVVSAGGQTTMSAGSNNDDVTNGSRVAGSQLTPGEHSDLAERVSERAISVLPEVDCDSANFQNYELGILDRTDSAVEDGITAASPKVAGERPDGSGDDDTKRRSPDGQGGSASGSDGKTGSQEFLENKDKEDEAAAKRGCCSCCTKLCMPCRRSRCSRCCRRKRTAATLASNNNNDDEAQPVLSSPSSSAGTTTTANLEVVDETKKTKGGSCWKNLNCCKRKKKKDSTSIEQDITASEQQQMETIREDLAETMTGPAKQSKCGLCLSKVFCCRSVNKVKTTTPSHTDPDHESDDDIERRERRKCCFCIPCGRKRARGPTAGGSTRGSSAAWQDPERAISATDASVLEGAEGTAPKQGCCKRFWGKLLCCRKKPTPTISDSRRASMKAATPVEDTRRKLHVDLVEYNSKMKGAIPVLPLYLAWFCAICNTVFPGLGTLLSGIFCICVGIPRFSHYDSAKARLGALIINTIVAVAQLFCVLFCFVGWGWSIWWGTIMLKCAKKLSKIKKVERLELEEEQRQSQMAAATAAVAASRNIIASETEAAKA